MMPIVPKYFHFVFGLKKQEEPFHVMHFICLWSCHLINQPDKIYFHYQYEPYGVLWDFIKPYLTLVRINNTSCISSENIPDNYKAYEYAHQSDVIRLDVLLEYGGVYADMDTLFMKPYPDSFFERECIMGEETGQYIDGKFQGSLCNAILIAKKDAPFIRTWREDIISSYGKDWSGHSTFLPYSIWKKKKHNIQVEPPISFFHFNWTSKGINDIFENIQQVPDKLYSIHLWAHLWWNIERNDFSPFNYKKLNLNYLFSKSSTYACIVYPLLTADIISLLNSYEEEIFTHHFTNGKTIVITSHSTTGKVFGASLRIRYLVEMLNKAKNNTNDIEVIDTVELGQKVSISLKEKFSLLLNPFIILHCIALSISLKSFIALNKVLRNKSYNNFLIFRGTIFPLINKKHLTNKKVFIDLDENDANTLFKIAKIYFSTRNYSKALKSFYAALIVSIEEKQIAQKNFSFSFSNWNDAKKFLKLSGYKNQPIVINNRLPKKDRNTSAKTINQSIRILFIGNYNYYPNQDAVNYLINSICPLLLKNNISFIIDIVGNGLDNGIKGDKNILYHGYIEDIGMLYESAFCTMIPIRAGGGPNYKTIEAFAYGLPVIASDEGISGIVGKANDHFLVANTPQQFVDALLQLCNDKALYERLIKNGKQLYNALYSS